MKTKKLFILLGLAVFAAGAGEVFPSAADAKPSMISRGSPVEPAQKKRCEKCKRGADGKMECVVVACPN